MTQSASTPEKPIDSPGSRSTDQKDPSPGTAEGTQSNDKPKALPPDPTPNEKEPKAVAEEKAPPLPPKDRNDDSTHSTPTPLELSQLGDFTYYKPSSNHVVSPIRELPPDFLEPTAEDLRSAQASLAARSRAYQEAPLLTESLRKKKEEELRNRWPTTTIRIKFADMSVLEKSFPSTSVIKPVYAFVRSCLHETAKSHKFVLYEPPRRELKVSDPNVRDKSLFDLHLAPRTVLHFRFVEDHVKLDPMSGPAPLYTEILSRAIPLPQPAFQDPSAPPPPPPASSPPKRTPSTRGSGSRLLESFDKDKKIAKLLKLTRKY